MEIRREVGIELPRAIIPEALVDIDLRRPSTVGTSQSAGQEPLRLGILTTHSTLPYLNWVSGVLWPESIVARNG